ncbi:unnamed protein product [Brachionus calyciflorus]|uniref:Ion transport domain-containing protein n=1 Tax=Brachionus calyciflorus TaxID=104777 RepID=A0A814DJN0_9BILA|nr:unnamed protein product [Brachionus calyciflorus]
MRSKLQAKYPMGNFTQFSLQKVYENHKSTSPSLLNKRVSLITGKPINIMPTSRRGKQYRRLQMTVYNYLERPSGAFAISYQLFIFATVFLCLILSVLATIPTYEVTASNILMQTEMIIVVWLSVELSLRVWSAGCRSRYQTWKGRLKFMKNAFCILDLTVIVASITLTVIASSQNKHKNFAAAAFRGLRFFQILRMLRVDRRAGTWRLLGNSPI